MSSISDLLRVREMDGLLRSIKQLDFFRKTDFISNDYLGLSRSSKLHENILAALKEYFSNEALVGATGSRLVSGNSKLLEDLEKEFAEFFEAEECLIVESGFSANQAFFSTVPQKNDIVIYDENIHASVYEGMKVSRGTFIKFSHNDLVDLERKITQSARNCKVFVVVESIYSMEGDESPLVAISAICERFECRMIVDEAHGFGVFGAEGRGKCFDLKIHKKVFFRLYTFGKAFGYSGAAMILPKEVKSFLLNFARSLIYTTYLPYTNLVIIKECLRLIRCAEKERSQLKCRIMYFQKIARESGVVAFESNSPIQAILIPGNFNCMRLANLLEHFGILVGVMRSPTVPKGKERIRICIHSFNTESEIDNLFKCLNKSNL